tara:strand:- start:106 stop:438 length:333 start_codon:yes stop_codon:yes gene_type:complete
MLSPRVGKHIVAKCGKTCKLKQSKREIASKICETFYHSYTVDDLINEFAKRNSDLQIKKESENTFSIQLQECKCQLVADGLNNSFLCNCSLGSTKEIFELLLKKPVYVEL